MFDGMEIGAKDHNGKMIKCGDKVSFTQFRKGYLVTNSEDGWGRTIRLCHHDQYQEPDKTKTTKGVISYDPSRTGFVINFEDCTLGSGRRKDDLYMFLNKRDDKLFII